MKGNDYPWAEQTRSSLENEYVNLLLQLHNYYISKRNFTSAMKVLKKARRSDARRGTRTSTQS